jgi:hypothetical protein
MGLAITFLGVFQRVLQAARRHELFEIVGRVDNHQHAGARVHDLLEPLGEQRHVKDHDDVCGLHRLQRSLALADRRHPDLGPRRYRIHAHLVDIAAERLGGGEGGFDIFAPRGQIADARHGLARLHLAHLELLLEQECEFSRIDFRRTNG